MSTRSKKSILRACGTVLCVLATCTFIHSAHAGYQSAYRSYSYGDGNSDIGGSLTVRTEAAIMNGQIFGARISSAQVSHSLNTNATFFGSDFSIASSHCDAVRDPNGIRVGSMTMRIGGQSVLYLRSSGGPIPMAGNFYRSLAEHDEWVWVGSIPVLVELEAVGRTRMTCDVSIGSWWSPQRLEVDATPGVTATVIGRATVNMLLAWAGVEGEIDLIDISSPGLVTLRDNDFFGLPAQYTLDADMVLEFLSGYIEIFAGLIGAGTASEELGSWSGITRNRSLYYSSGTLYP